MKKFIPFICIIILGIGVGLTFTTPNANRATSQKNVLASHVTKTPSPTMRPTFGTPKYISIPAIGLNTIVESVGMDSQGRMDVPKDANNTAWFDLGYHPGQNGNAVIDGHYDKADGTGAAFWNISHLVKGDKIILTDDKGMKLTFAVTNQTKYQYDTFPIKEIFGEAAVPRLNLITCHGQWNKNTKNYSQRLVVNSELVGTNRQ